MIFVSGNTEGAEAEAANTLRKLIIESWPWMESDLKSEIHIIAGVKCHGQVLRDLDLVVFGQFSERALYKPFLPFFCARDNTLKKPALIHACNLCVTIEIKDSNPASMRFIGTQVEVQYGNQWKNITEQSHRQIFSLKNYLQINGINAPHITNLIWLRGVETVDLPKFPHNIIGGNATWDLFINVIAQQSPPRLRDGKWLLDANFQVQPGGFQSACNLLTKTILPTNLDRKKMDRICRHSVNPEWFSNLQNKDLVFRGRGGTGKTIILLQLAWKAYEESNSRVLLLTYNKALVADMRRIFTLMNLPDHFAEKTIQIKTIHSFLYSTLVNLGFDFEEAPFLTNYEEYKERALSFIREGAVLRSDIDDLIRKKDDFKWDFILIDEGQDWPENERALLDCLYPDIKFAVADGIDQLVRQDKTCDWRAPKTTKQVQTINLASCLRMKAGLARFTSLFANELGLSKWIDEPNIDAPGGRVIIIEGDYFRDKNFHGRLMNYNKADGNQPVDMLVCIPHSLVVRGDNGENISSLVADHFIALGQEVWDGVSADIRTSYPTSINQLRIVQYDSCRGLEGWVVINLALDKLYEHKKSLWRPPEKFEPGSFIDDPSLAHLYAARWLMIPMTRAVDTLVIQISSHQSVIREALLKAANQCADFVQWEKDKVAD